METFAVFTVTVATAGLEAFFGAGFIGAAGVFFGIVGFLAAVTDFEEAGVDTFAVGFGVTVAAAGFRFLTGAGGAGTAGVFETAFVFVAGLAGSGAGFTAFATDFAGLTVLLSGGAVGFINGLDRLVFAGFEAAG
ncbi:MAG: hypothetical protein JSS81_25460 [Acidobacteria bacterium]|nr:hypothetical protein [Acidobacteriota bacterium]